MLWRYLIIINIITFLIRWLDKRKAMSDRWRISEKQLLTLVAAGWFVGAFAGMSFFRHKTLKWSFQAKMYLVIFAWIVIIALYTKDPEIIKTLIEAQ